MSLTQVMMMWSRKQRMLPILATLLCATPVSLHAQGDAATCPANQRLEARVGFDSFDCNGCRLRRDPETGLAYIEFSRPPVLRGVGSGGPLRDGDQLTHVDGTSILTTQGARKLAALERGVETRFTVTRNNASTVVVLAPEYVCRAVPSGGWRVRADSSAEVMGGWQAKVFGNVWGSQPNALPQSWPTLWRSKDTGDTTASSKQKWGELLQGNLADGTFSRLDWALGSFSNLKETRMQPQGWFGFSLDCDSCTYGAPDATASANQGARWNFPVAPRIVSVDSGGPADRAGLRVGDILVSIDDVAINSSAGGDRFSSVKAGDTVIVAFTRGRTTRRVTLVVEQRPGGAQTWSTGYNADFVLRAGSQPGAATVEIRGSNITVTDDPKTGERTITGSNMTVVVKPPVKPPE